MNIFTLGPRPTGLMFSKASSINQGCFACQLDNVIMQTYEGLNGGSDIQYSLKNQPIIYLIKILGYSLK